MKALLFALSFLPLIPAAQPQEKSIEGTWKFLRERSTDLATWRYRIPRLEISRSGDQLAIVRTWMERDRAASVDSFAFVVGGSTSSVPVSSKIWPENWYMGVLAIPGSRISVSGVWIHPGSDLRVETEQTVEISQGQARIVTQSEYRLDASGDTLMVSEQRSSRPTPVVLTFHRLAVSP
jgi:hypothetical protein